MTLRPVVLAMLVWCAGCSCELSLDDSADEPCALFGTACPDGSCVVAPLGGEECCGFGGECPPCDGAWIALECPDGTCVSVIDPDACCSHGGACDPGDDDPPHRSSDAGEASDATTVTSEESSTTIEGESSENTHSTGSSGTAGEDAGSSDAGT